MLACVTPARRSLAALAGTQLAVVATVAAYAAQGPLRTDGGLRQLDVLSLDEPVRGIRATGRPQLVVAAGDQAVPACRSGVAEALRRRGGPGGVASAYDLVLLIPGVRAGAGTTADPGGSLAIALALPDAARGCRPGYAVVDPRGHVRYRTYDAQWAVHANESDVLLAALR